MSALVKGSTRQGGINLLRRASCGFARTEPMVCCSSQLDVREEEIEERVVTQQRVGGNNLTPSGRVGSNSLSGKPSGRVGDTGSSSAVRFGGSISTVGVETSRRAGEEEFSRRTGFGEERVEEAASGEDWGEVSSSEEEDHHHEHRGGDVEWRGGEGESWGAVSGNEEEEEEYEGEDWGVQSLGTKCVTAFDCV